MINNKPNKTRFETKKKKSAGLWTLYLFDNYRDLQKQTFDYKIFNSNLDSSSCFGIKLTISILWLQTNLLTWTHKAENETIWRLTTGAPQFAFSDPLHCRLTLFWLFYKSNWFLEKKRVSYQKNSATPNLTHHHLTSLAASYTTQLHSSYTFVFSTSAHHSPPKKIPTQLITHYTRLAHSPLYSPKLIWIFNEEKSSWRWQVKMKVLLLLHR